MTEQKDHCPCKQLIDLKIEIGGLKEVIRKLEHKLSVACDLIEHIRREQ